MKRAYILAGGRSQRFGSDKARVQIEGIPQITRLVTPLGALGYLTTIVAQNRSDYEDLGFERIADSEPDGGPLAGILAALADCQTAGLTHALVINCDLIARDWQWLAAMEARFQETEPLMVVFESIGFLPLPGIYSIGVLEPARKLWDNGKRSLRDLHGSLRDSIERIPWLADAIPRSFNTPGEFREILDL